MDATHAALPTRAGIYCRLSYAPDGSVEKVERQEGDCRDLGGRLRWPLSDRHVYVDNSRSAWQRNRKRPAWDRMLADIEAGEIDAIIVYHGDRLIRQPYDLERLIGIADTRGIRIASVSGTRDLDSPDDRFILRIEAAQACRESDNTSRRTRRDIAASVAKGHTRTSGRRAFGFGVQTGTRIRTNALTGEQREVPVYDMDQQVPEEAHYLDDAADMLLAGRSQGGVIAWFASEGVTTTEGNPMTARGLRHLLLAPRVAGLIEYQGVLYEAAWDGILSREKWEAVRAYYRASAAENPYQGRERRYLLTGIAECHACGHTVRTKPTGGRNRPDARIYHCGNPACRGVGRNLTHLDAYVEARTVRLLNDPAFLGELSSAAEQPTIAAEIAALTRRRDETQQQLDALADHPDVDVTAALVGLAGFEKKLRALRDQLSATSQMRMVGRMTGITREEWEAEPVDVRAATIAALWRVVILPATWRGPGFSPSSVSVTRRPVSPTGTGREPAEREP